MTISRYLAILLLALHAPGARADEAPPKEPIKAAVFDFTLIDTSTEGDYNGVRADETARLAMISAQLREALTESGRYEVIDVAPMKERIESVNNVADCNGCDTKMARELGAEVAVVGEVQKVSNLILAINIFIRDAETGDLVQGAAADIRGNNDRSWERGVSWLLRNRILREK